MPNENVAFQVININTDEAVQSTLAMADEMKKAAAAAKQLREDAGETFEVFNSNVQESVGYARQLKEENEKTCAAIREGMKSAAAATKVESEATEELAAVHGRASKGIFSSVQKQKIAFQDLGRVITGQGFSLRSVATNFTLLGPAITIAAVAIAGIAYAWFKTEQKTDDATRSAKEYMAVMDKGAESIAKVQLDVQKMGLSFQEAKEGTLTHREVLEEYNKTFGETLGKAKTFNEAEATFVSKSDAYAQGMAKRAMADAAYGLEQEQLAIQIKATAGASLNGWQKVDLFFVRIFKGEKEADELRKNILKGQGDDAEVLAEHYKSLGDEAKKAGDAILTAAGIHPHKPDKTGHDTSLEEQKRYIAESQKILEDAQQKEITAENIKYQKIFDDLKKNHHSTEALTEQHNKNLSDIDEKYENERAKKLAAARAKFAEELLKEQQKGEAELLKGEEEFIKKADQSEENKFQKELAQTQAEYKKLLAEAMLYGKDTTALTAAYHKQIESINEAQAAQNKKDADKAITDSIKANKDANEQIVKSLTLTNNQKLALLKKDLDAYKAQLAEKRVLSDEDATKDEDDLEAYKKIQHAKLEAQKEAIGGIASVLNSASEVLGRNTQAGKDIAIAAATISAIQGAISAFTSLSVIPIIGPELGIIAAAAALAAGYENIHKIEAVKVPGQGGAGTASAPAVSAPTIPQRTATTNISQGSINQMRPQSQTEPLRAVVVERDMTNSQNRVAGYQQGSSLH